MSQALFILSLSTLAILPFSDQESESCKQIVYVDGQADGCVSEFPGTYPADDPSAPAQVGEPTR